MNIDKKTIIDNFYKKSTNLINLSSDELKLLNIINTKLINNFKSDNLELSNKQIVLSYKFMSDLAKKDLFKQQSSTAHYLTKKLVKHKLISKKSILYPKNIKFFSTNPLSNCFLNTNMRTVDNFINILNDFVINEILSDDIKLYIYLRLFYIKKLSKKEILLLDRNSLIELQNHSILIIYEIFLNKDAYNPMKILFADEYIKKIYNSIKEKESSIFKENVEYYEKQLQKFLKENSLNYNQARISLEFVYQIKNSPLKLNLQKTTRYPKITLHELDYIIPSHIPKNLLEIEKRNIEKYFNTNQINDDYEFLDINDIINEYIQNDLKEYDVLKTVLNFPNEDKNKVKFLDYWYNFLKNEKSEYEVINKIKEYILFILMKADSRNSQNIKRNKYIKMSTAKDYLSIAFKYAFNYIIAEGEINSKTISLINDNLLYNENLTPRTISTYKRIVNLFLLKFTNYNSLNKIKSVIDIRRSIVFKNEFEKFVDLIYHDGLEKYKLNKNSKIKALIKPVFLILLYNSGLRRTELRTRLVIDIKKISDLDFTIDVNYEGFKETAASTGESELDMKSYNSKRRVRFTVNNRIHLKMLTDYLTWIEKYKYKFLFPMISKKNFILKKSASTDYFFSDLSSLLQKHTSRYTPLHSLRHSFCTKYFIENIKLKNYQDIMYELANIMGHCAPEVTIENYIHFDLLNLSEKNLQNCF